jgi:hypothetical protein
MSAENKEADDMHGDEEEEEEDGEEDDHTTTGMDGGVLLSNDGATFWREEEGHEGRDRGRGGRDDGAYYAPSHMTDPNDRIYEDSNIDPLRRIALTFSTQGLGFISVPLLAYPMLELGFDTDVIWRVLLGVGALPGLLVLYLRLRDGRKNAGGRTTIKNQETETVVTRRDEPAVSDVGSASDASSINRVEPLELPTSNQRNDDENNAESSTLFFDLSCSESNEMALVENSHLQDDGARLDQRLEIQDDASTSPIREHPRGV